MDQYLFENVNGFPMPRLPQSTGGAVTVDGVRFFGLNQAAGHFAGFTEEKLREIWTDVFPWARTRQTLPLPDLTAAPLSVVEGWKIAMRYSRVTKYRHFSDEQFAEFLGRAAALQLNPLSGQVYGALRPDPETRMPIVTLIVGIAGFRSIAQRTGERAGTEAVEFVMGNRTTTYTAPDPADPKRMVRHTRPVPESATGTIYRRGPAGDVPYTLTVHWDDCYPAHLAPSLWDERPRACLSRSLFAALYRDAYPETGLCYVREELMGPPAGGGTAADGAPPATEASVDVGAEDEDPPATDRQLQLRMVDLGVRCPKRRREIIDQLRKEWRCFDDNPTFFANAYRSLRNNPRRFDIDAA